MVEGSEDRPESHGIFQDWAYQTSLKSRVVLALFRLAQRAGRWPRGLAPARFVVIACYRLTSEWLLGIDLPWQVRVGPRLRLYHGQALVVHEASVLGADCSLRHSTTLGTKDPSTIVSDDAPILGDSVDVGCHAVILGKVHVGAGTIVAAGSVVVGDLPDRSIAAGNPARVVSENPHPPVGPGDRARRLE